MKNLNKLGLILGVGGMSALVFSLAACGDDPAPAPTGGSSGSGTSGSAGSGTSGSGGSSAGSGTSGSGGSGTSGSGGSSAGKAGAGGGGAGGAGGGSGGEGGSSGSGGGGAGGGGGGGGAPSAACMKLCMGADSIVTICAADGGVDADLKMTDTCLQRCALETDMAKVKCWQDHAINFKTQMGDHCKHAGGDAPCTDWPEL